MSSVTDEMLKLRLHFAWTASEDGHPFMLSLSDVIHFIAEHMADWKDCVGSTSVVEMIAAQKERPVTMTESDHVIVAFQLMQKNHITGVGVVDGAGELVADFSTSVLRQLCGSFQDRLPGVLFLPVHACLLEASKSARLSAPVSVRSNGSLADVVKKMALFHNHRIWVVDDTNRPVRVITPFEVLPFFLRANLN
jgi:CBS domain-containing protein